MPLARAGDGVLPFFARCDGAGGSRQPVAAASLSPLRGGDYVQGLGFAVQAEMHPALEALERSYAAAPRGLTAAWIGAGYDRLGQTAEAKSWWQKSDEAGFFLLRLADHCGRLGDAEAERRYYNLAADSLGPKWTPAHQQVVLYYGRSGLAAGLDRLVARLSPAEVDQDVAALVALGQALRAQKRHAEALAHFERAAELAPRDHGVARLAADAAIRAGDFALARAYADRALTLSPGDQRSYELLGRIARREGKLDEAYAWFERSGSSDGLRNMAEVRTMQRRYAEAMALYDQVLEADRRAPVLRRAAQVAVALEDLALARDLAHEAVKKEPESLEALLLLAQVCRRQGDRDCAVEQYRAALAVEPDNAVARRGLEEFGAQP